MFGEVLTGLASGFFYSSFTGFFSAGLGLGFYYSSFFVLFSVGAGF